MAIYAPTSIQSAGQLVVPSMPSEITSPMPAAPESLVYEDQPTVTTSLSADPYMFVEGLRNSIPSLMWNFDRLQRQTIHRHILEAENSTPPEKFPELHGQVVDRIITSGKWGDYAKKIQEAKDAGASPEDIVKSIKSKNPIEAPVVPKELGDKLLYSGGKMWGDLWTMMIGGAVGGWGGAIGLPSGLEAMLRYKIEKGEITNKVDFAKYLWEAVKETGKGVFVGKAGGEAMSLTKALIGKEIATATGKAVVSPRYWGRPLEGAAGITGFTGAQGIVEGKMPTWEDWVVNAVMFAGMEGSVSFANRLRMKKSEGKSKNQAINEALQEQQAEHLKDIMGEDYSADISPQEHFVRNLEKTQAPETVGKTRDDIAREKYQGTRMGTLIKDRYPPKPVSPEMKLQGDVRVAEGGEKSEGKYPMTPDMEEQVAGRQAEGLLSLQEKGMEPRPPELPIEYHIRMSGRQAKASDYYYLTKGVMDVLDHPDARAAAIRAVCESSVEDIPKKLFSILDLYKPLSDVPQAGPRRNITAPFEPVKDTSKPTKPFKDTGFMPPEYVQTTQKGILGGKGLGLEPPQPQESAFKYVDHPLPKPENISYGIAPKIQGKVLPNKPLSSAELSQMGEGSTLGMGPAQAIYELGKKLFGDKTYRQGMETELSNLRMGLNYQARKEGVSPNILRDAKNNLFTPEAVSSLAREADPKIAAAMTAHQRAKDILHRESRESSLWWDRQPEELRVPFLVAMEEGKAGGGQLGEYAKDFKNTMQQIYKAEKAAGIEYDSLDNYVSHVFDRGSQVQAFMRNYAKSVGKAWFAEQRDFRFLRDALEKGKYDDGTPFKLKETNPEKLKLIREYASDLAITRKQLMDDFAKSGMAEPYTKGTMKPGWVIVDDPLGNRYQVAPDLAPLLKNSLFAKSLYNSEGLGGKSFRAWMELKNTLIPIKLGLSGFHAIHVATMLQPALRIPVYQQILSGTMGWAQGVKELAKTIGPIQHKKVREGYSLLQAWRDPKNASFADAEAVRLMIEGGFSPQMGEVWKTKALDNFREAVNSGRYPTAALRGIQTVATSLQYPLFEVYIPSIKAAAFANEARMLLERRPELLNDATARGVELRKIGQSTDNRFGEMNYNTLFWNKTMKEAGIGSALSLGWQLGFIREYGGAFFDAKAAATNLIKGKGSVNDITTRMLFVADYSMQTAIMCGVASYMLTGVMPEAIDYFYPATGHINPDGSKERLNTPFYAKEFFALADHWKKEGLIKGTFTVAKNKLNPAIASLTRLWENKDFYNREIYNEESRYIDQAQQIASYLISEFEPISLGGVKRAKETGSPIAEKTSWLGFNPAPAYAVRDEIQNRITSLYSKRFGGGVITQERGAKQDVKKEIRNAYLKGNISEANTKLTDAVSKGIIKPESVGKFVDDCDLPGDIRLFRQFEADDQVALMKHMNYVELSKYAWYAKKDVRLKVRELGTAGAKLFNDYQNGKAEEPKWFRGKRIQGVGNIVHGGEYSEKE